MQQRSILWNEYQIVPFAYRKAIRSFQIVAGIRSRQEEYVRYRTDSFVIRSLFFSSANNFR